MHEQTKALPRRISDPAYRRYFRGRGIDLGAGPDPLDRNKDQFPSMISAIPWDKEQGDAQTLSGVVHDAFDFIFASHLLEHLDHPRHALNRWLEVIKPHGYLIVTVPDWEMYERYQWPSRFSPEHKWAFTMDTHLTGITMPHLISLVDVLDDLVGLANLERLLVLREHFNPNAPVMIDQTMGPAECAIEFVLRKTP